MKKILLIAIILFFVAGCKNIKTPTTKKNTTQHKYNYYKEEYKKRYDSYKSKNPSLSEKDIITRVNIGLDYPFYTNTKETSFLNTDYILVNKYYYLKSNYIPNTLEKISSECSLNTRMLEKNAKEAFEKLCMDAKADNLTIRAMSSYRSYEYQNTLYKNYAQKDGVETADTYSARPGFSEHQTGLVVDVDNGKDLYTDFEKTKEFTWMEKNAHHYGFILRYPKDKENVTGYSYESWHYRYVGKEIAEDMKKKNITFDEYYIRYLEK